MSSPSEMAPRSWQRTASEDLWVRTLSQIPTRIGRMAYLSRLMNPETERYEHHGLTAIFGEDAAENALKNSHWDALESFLGLGVLDQRDDVAKYTGGLPQSARRLLESWDRTQGYNGFLPRMASPAQRELYEANLRLIVRHLRNEGGAGEVPPVP